MHQKLVPAFSIKLRIMNRVACELISGTKRLNLLTVRKKMRTSIALTTELSRVSQEANLHQISVITLVVWANILDMAHPSSS